MYQKNFTHTWQIQKNKKMKKNKYSEMGAAHNQENQGFLGANASPSTGTSAQTSMVRGTERQEDWFWQLHGYCGSSEGVKVVLRLPAEVWKANPLFKKATWI